MSTLKNFVLTAFKAYLPQVTTVRFRYHADKKRLVRRYGLTDKIEKIDMRGPLARESDKVVKQMPIYRPTDSWSEKKAVFGQNDYIDIFGNGEIKPKDIMYNVPRWLRGVQGTEFQVLLKKRKAWQHGIYPIARPTKWRDLNKRIMYLWKFMNRKYKTFPSPN